MQSLVDWTNLSLSRSIDITSFTIESYLLNRSFYGNIENSNLSIFQLLYIEFLKDMSLSLHLIHHSSQFCHNIALQQIITFVVLILNFSYHSQLDVFNFLSIDPSKSEFLIFGLTQQLYR